ncbi:MAG: hypothetical protein NZM35_06475 [Chitinophagales bacterium]|nr:hypothetical protein [Chitinophagales bacterium]MDW8419292.1 hypothetical protein [Chitinophagales bacterium]
MAQYKLLNLMNCCRQATGKTFAACELVIESKVTVLRVWSRLIASLKSIVKVATGNFPSGKIAAYPRQLQLALAFAGAFRSMFNYMNLSNQKSEYPATCNYLTLLAKQIQDLMVYPLKPEINIHNFTTLPLTYFKTTTIILCTAAQI